MRQWLFLLGTAGALWAQTVSGWAAQVNLAWDPVTPAPEGYRLFHRAANGSYNYSLPAWSGTTTTCTATNLVDGTQYHFVVRAYQGNLESGNSNEIAYTTPAANRAPVAEAGLDQSIAGGALVTLNGSGSSDPDGGTLTYAWTQTGGTGVQLSDSRAARPTFTAPAATSTAAVLTFSLRVTDPGGLSSTDTCRVQIGAVSSVNRAPVANAGADQTVTGGALVTLNGSASTDPDGNALTYAWSQISGASVQLSDSRAVRPTFAAPAATATTQVLTFSLNVADTGGLSSTATCRVLVSSTGGGSVVTNNPPAQPQMTYPAQGATGVSRTPTLKASAFSDPDTGDRHAQSEWLIAAQSDRRKVLNVTRSSWNLTSLWVPWFVLSPGTGYICQVRYFDSRGAASPWSPEIFFSTAPRTTSQSAALAPESGGIPATITATDDSLKTVLAPDGQTMGVGIGGVSGIVSLDEVAAAATTDDSPPPEMELPYGLLGYRIQVQQPGQQVKVGVYFDEPVDPLATWMTYGKEGRWLDCSSLVAVRPDGSAVDRQITDGGPDDADGVANGVIVDLLAPQAVNTDGTAPGTGLTDGGSSSAPPSSGGGCFIRSLLK